jgi:amidase
VGLKPTIGLVSRSGIVPIAHSQDTAGPMARTVTDAAILLGVLAGADPSDAATRASGHADYTTALDANGLRGARLGVVRQRLSGANRQTDALFDAALAMLKAQGAVLVDPAELATLGKFDDAEFEVLLYEFKADLEKYLRSRPAGSRVRTLDDLIAFDRAHAAEEMPYFGHEIVEMAAKKGPLSSAGYRKARARCIELSRRKGIDATLKKHRLDALVMPTQGPPALIDLVNGDPSSWSSTTPAAVADSLPVGLSFTGPAWSEPLLLKYGYAYEQTSRMRRPPRFLATAELAHP